MKIIYLTDIHGSFNQVETLLIETVADVYIISGDLIDIPFYNIDTAIKYFDMQNSLRVLRKKMEREDMILEDFVDTLMEIPDAPEDIISLGSNYQQYTIRARRVMQQKYKVLENILSLKPNADMFCLPGNYDMDLKFTSLHERNLHLRWHDIQGTKFAGYGGADVWTAGIPERYIINYNAGIGKQEVKNEMYTFFKAIKPNIIAVHQPPHGIHDRILYKGPSGSPILRSYCTKFSVSLCLSGHIHTDWGLIYTDQTLFLNPSNFGVITTTQGEISEGGFFYKIELFDNTVEKITFTKLVHEQIHEIAEYYPAGDRFQENIIDSDRYYARKRNENYDLKTKKYSHIPEIKLFKEIKQFFRMYQTQETEIRMDKLESVITFLTDEHCDIAMDIVGSVNLGMSQKGSDIDIVLYLKCDNSCPENIDKCHNLKKITHSISTILHDEYKFEILDCIDLNVVKESILNQNYECEITQRFVAYRSICRPVNYKIIAPLEDLLNKNIEFRKEMEGSIRAYFKIFINTSQHINSFDKYIARLKSIGIKLPDVIKKKIKDYLQIDGHD